jgi:hypothetical protein
MGAASLLSGLFGGRKSKEEKQQQKWMAEKAQYDIERGKQLDALALENLAGPQSFYQALLEGDRGMLARLYGPAISEMTAATEGTERNILRDLPRGGASELAMAQNRLGVTAQIGKLLSGAPAEGAKGLQSLFQTLLSGGQVAGAGGADVLTNLLRSTQTSDARQSAAWGQALQPIGELIGMWASDKYGWFDKTGKKGTNP